MSDYFNQLDPAVAEHVSGLRNMVRIQDDTEALEALARSWKDKEDAFVHQILVNKMEVIEELDPAEEECGVLLLTYSGSLISIGPFSDGKRKASYASIGLREDVPELAESDDSVLSGAIKTGEAVEFKKGPIQKSSPVFKIAVFSEELENSEEEERLSEMTQIIAEEFTEVNRTLASAE